MKTTTICADKFETGTYSKTQKWFVKFPGEAYANEFYGWNKADIINQAKRYLKVMRLPVGTEIWKA